MAYRSVFERREIKYLLTRDQQQRVLEAMAPYMEQDEYGRSVICNLYYDTDNYRMIRHSLEHPLYKEKLRLRSYGPVKTGGQVFVEVKKKYRGVVHKRRIALPEEAALDWLGRGVSPTDHNQITREVDWLLHYYENLHPTVYLNYERQAYYCRDGSEFRVTFDDTILCRTTALSLEEPSWGTPLLAQDTVLMELKCPGAIPLWMSSVLGREQLYKATFSKYGTAYQRLIFPQIKEGFSHV